MTMVRKLRSRSRPVRVAGAVMFVVLVSLSGVSRVAAEPPVHYHHAGIMPPGAIGSQQLLRGGPLPGYFQPVEVRGPAGSQIAPAIGDDFGDSRGSVLTAGLLIGAVYRLRVMDVPGAEGIEVFPTVEVIDRIYPPIGQEFRFPIPVELTQEELTMAASGQFVTRVIYLEDPDTALPVAREGNEQAYFEAPDGDNPLDVADSLGRPVAILRMGGRVPDASGPDAAFMYGSPPMVIWNPHTTETPLLLEDAQAGTMRREINPAQTTSAVISSKPIARQPLAR